MADGGSRFAALQQALSRHARLGIAVSGGVDSMTLAHAAHRVLPSGSVTILHSATPAVQTDATARVRDHADRFGWRLRVIDAGEFADPDYLRNPANRCYFCKSNLYGVIRRETDGPIASGTNLDDLGDYRPGLKAADEKDVCHPFVEAGCSKADVRRLAREFGLDDVSELPAQPCLASRIETGLRVTPDDLRFIELVERRLADSEPGSTIRCRVVRGGVRLELEERIWRDPGLRGRAASAAEDICQRSGRVLVEVSPYVRGSAFRHVS
jgi:uncharacterized protein